MLKLYYSPGACSLASHIALREAGLDFQLERVDGRAKKTASGEDYWAVTPKGYVPALRLDSGEVLTEGTAIMPYIADQKPSARLASGDSPMVRHRVQEWLGYLNSEVHKGFGPFFSPATTDEQKAAARTALGKKFDFVQKELGDRPYLLGAGFTIADAYLFTVLGWCALVGIDLAQWPALKVYHARVAARPAVLAAMQAEGLVK